MLARSRVKMLARITKRESATIIQNKTCQLYASMMKPAALGPNAGAKAMTMPNRPLAKPRFSGGNVSMMTVMTMGIRMPAPAA